MEALGSLGKTLRFLVVISKYLLYLAINPCLKAFPESSTPSECFYTKIELVVLRTPPPLARFHFFFHLTLREYSAF